MNLKISILFLLTGTLMLLEGCGGADREARADPWDRVEDIIRQIHEPGIPEEVFRLSEYGGSGDGMTDNKPAFDRIIQACAEAGAASGYFVHGPCYRRPDYRFGGH